MSSGPLESALTCVCGLTVAVECAPPRCCFKLTLNPATVESVNNENNSLVCLLFKLRHISLIIISATLDCLGSDEQTLMHGWV